MGGACRLAWRRAHQLRPKTIFRTSLQARVTGWRCRYGKQNGRGAWRDWFPSSSSNVFYPFLLVLILYSAFFCLLYLCFSFGHSNLFLKDFKNSCHKPPLVLVPSANAPQRSPCLAASKLKRMRPSAIKTKD